MTRKFFDIRTDSELIDWHAKDKATAVRLLMERPAGGDEVSLDIWRMNRDEGVPDVKILTLTGQAHVLAAVLASMDLDSL